MSVDQQNAQLLAWLDEEHRRDKTLISELRGQIDQQLTQINGLARGISDLEERLARVQSQSLRYSQIEQAVGQLKTEIGVLFDQSNQRQQTLREDDFKVRQKEKERVDKALADLATKVDDVAQQWRPYAPDHDAIKRLENGQVPLARGQEELSKRQEALSSRLAVTEEWVKRTGALIAEIQQLSERLRQDRADALETQRRADQIRARQITEWNEQMKVAKREMDDWVSKLTPLLDLPKDVRGSLSDLKQLEDDLKQIEPRLSQRQKLVEEFSRTEIEGMKVEMDKRLSSSSRDWEYWKDEFQKKLQGLGARFEPLEEWRPTVPVQFREIREKMESDRQRWLDILVEVVHMEVEYQRAENMRYDQMANELIKRVETAQAGAKPKRPTPPRSASTPSNR